MQTNKYSLPVAHPVKFGFIITATNDMKSSWFSFLLRCAEVVVAFVFCFIIMNGCRKEQAKNDPAFDKVLVAPKPGDAPYDGALQQLLTQATGEIVKIIFPVGTYRLTTDHSVPGNITFEMSKGSAFYIEEGCTLTHNGQVNSPAGYLFRGEGKVAGSISGTGYVQWFGADEVTTDHTVSFQKALDVCEQVFVPDRPNGYVITHLVFDRPVVFKGIGTNRVQIKVKDDGQQHFLVLHSDHIVIENIELSCFYSTDDLMSSEMAVFFNTSDRGLSDIILRNVFINHPAYGIGDACSGEYTIRNVLMDYVYIDANRNTGMHMNDFRDGIELRDVCISSFRHNVPSKGYIFENITGMHLENVDVLGGYGKNVRGGDGMTFINCEGITCYRVMVDYVSGKQLVIRDSKNFNFSNFVVSLLAYEGLYLENVTNSVFSITNVNGIYNKETPIMVLVNCSGLTFNSLMIQVSMNDNLMMYGCSNNIFNNTVILNGAGQTLFEDSTSSNNIFNGLVSNGNKGGFSLLGTDSKVYGFLSDANGGKILDTVQSPYSY